MIKNSLKLTTAQFASLHNINKRTLHYYDSIGLFSPHTVGENGYRYYDLSQSIAFENLLMLRELNMSIDEMKAYVQNPDPQKFLSLSHTKELELEEQIKRLQNIKNVIQEKKKQIEFCQNLKESKIEIQACREEKLLVLPYDFYENDLSNVFTYMKNNWNIEQIRMGVGGIISSEKVIKHDFSRYDGIYTPALKQTPDKDIFLRPQGNYICCYHRGAWDTLPLAYEKILAFAQNNRLTLTGFAYEMGLNEFAITEEKDYVTKMMIRVL